MECVLSAWLLLFAAYLATGRVCHSGFARRVVSIVRLKLFHYLANMRNSRKLSVYVSYPLPGGKNNARCTSNWWSTSARKTYALECTQVE